MIQAEEVSDLVQQDGQQVDAAKRITSRICCTAEFRQDCEELAVILRGRIDEPTTACSRRVQRDEILIGGAQFAIGQIGDANL